MTNLKDLLNDFADEITVISGAYGGPQDYEEKKKEAIENLLKIIVERLIGE